MRVNIYGVDERTIYILENYKEFQFKDTLCILRCSHKSPGPTPFCSWPSLLHWLQLGAYEVDPFLLGAKLLQPMFCALKQITVCPRAVSI